MKKFVRIAIMIVLGLSSAVPAFVADDDVLVRILTRANIANNFTEYCAQFDPSIIQSTRSAIGDTRALAQHIRGEVVAGLPFEEANQIIIRSAQAARASALLSVRRFYGPNPDEERTRLTEWPAFGRTECPRFCERARSASRSIGCFYRKCQEISLIGSC